MAQFSLSTQVNAPINKVFRKFSDFPNAADMIEGIVRVEMLTDEPIGKGTRFNETRVMFGKEATEEMEVTEFDPHKKYTLSAISCGAKFDSTFTFTEHDGGTRVDLDLQTKSLTLMAKLMSPLGALMMGSMKKCVQADMDQIKAACEA